MDFANHFFQSDVWDIEHSLPLAGQALYRDISGDPNNDYGNVYTLSMWVKGWIYDECYIWNNNQKAGDGAGVMLLGDGTVTLRGNAENSKTESSQKIRDIDAWHHIVFQQVAGSNRGDIYVDGKQKLLSNSANSQLENKLVIGGLLDAGNTSISKFYQGKIAEVHLVTGSLENPETFAHFDENGVWTPHKVSIADYGPLGFYLKFKDLNNLGKDYSGNGNDFTGFDLNTDPTNDNVAQSKDTPTHNYPVLNRLYMAGDPVVNQLGDQFAYAAAGSSVAYKEAIHTQYIDMQSNSGKYQIEALIRHTSGNTYVGWAPIEKSQEFIQGEFSRTGENGGCAILNNGDLYSDDGTQAGAYPAMATETTIGLVFDTDNQKVEVYIDGVKQATDLESANHKPEGLVAFSCTAQQVSTGASVRVNTGHRLDFKYPVADCQHVNTATLAPITPILNPADYFIVKQFDQSWYTNPASPDGSGYATPQLMFDGVTGSSALAGGNYTQTRAGGGENIIWEPKRVPVFVGSSIEINNYAGAGAGGKTYTVWTTIDGITTETTYTTDTEDQWNQVVGPTSGNLDRLEIEGHYGGTVYGIKVDGTIITGGDHWMDVRNSKGPFEYAKAEFLNGEEGLIMIRNRSFGDGLGVQNYHTLTGLTSANWQNDVSKPAAEMFYQEPFGATSLWAWKIKPGDPDGVGMNQVVYAGNNTNGRPLAHGLAKTPDIYWTNSQEYNRGNVQYITDWNPSGGNYYIYHFDNKQSIQADGVTQRPDDTNVYWVNGTGSNRDTQYCATFFNHVPGFFTSGRYIADGTADRLNGPFQPLGFTPALVALRAANPGGTQSWCWFDCERGLNGSMEAIHVDQDTGGQVDDWIDFYNDGFQIKSTNFMVNTVGNEYFYMAWAKTPPLYGTATR